MKRRLTEISIVILGILIGILTNVATGALPDMLPLEWRNDLWLAWVPLAIAILVVLVLEWRASRGEPTPVPATGGDTVDGDKLTGDKVMGDKRTIDTSGGDYAEGNIDKRQGAFVNGGAVYGNIIGQQIVHQAEQSALAEDDYGVMLFDAWGTSQGKLKSADVVRLKAAQGRLGLTEAQAQQLEREVRITLAEENFNRIPTSAFECRTLGIAFIGNGPIRDEPPMYRPFIPSTETMAAIGQTVLFHKETGLRLLLERWPSKCPVDMDRFKAAFLKANSVLPGTEEFNSVEWFLTNLEAALSSR